MGRTYSQNFSRDDGSPITVEYEVEGSFSPTTYSPHSGACGGDAVKRLRSIGCTGVVDGKIAMKLLVPSKSARGRFLMVLAKLFGRKA